MTSNQYVAIAWEGSREESLPLQAILRTEGYVFTVEENEDLIRIEVPVSYTHLTLPTIYSV